MIVMLMFAKRARGSDGELQSGVPFPTTPCARLQAREAREQGRAFL